MACETLSTSAGKAFLEFANSTELIVSAKEFSANPSAAKLYLKQLFSGTVSFTFLFLKRMSSKRLIEAWSCFIFFLTIFLIWSGFNGLSIFEPLTPVGENTGCLDPDFVLTSAARASRHNPATRIIAHVANIQRRIAIGCSLSCNLTCTVGASA